MHHGKFECFKFMLISHLKKSGIENFKKDGMLYEMNKLENVLTA